MSQRVYFTKGENDFGVHPSQLCGWTSQFIDLYLRLAVNGICSEEVARKICLYPGRCRNFSENLTVMVESLVV